MARGKQTRVLALIVFFVAITSLGVATEIQHLGNPAHKDCALCHLGHVSVVEPGIANAIPVAFTLEQLIPSREVPAESSAVLLSQPPRAPPA